MPPQSRGNTVPTGFQSKSTPNLPTLRSLKPHTAAREEEVLSPVSTASPSEPASVEDSLQDEEEHGHFSLEPSEDSDSDMDEIDSPPTARPLFTSRSQSHLPPHTASSLFPPFYNRPPTPLPPSPSLTSLLRPSFSTTTSRPTTPDSSDVEFPNTGATNGTSTPTTANLASITKSARHAPTVPRASPKVPTYEYYGFALYLASSAAFLMYILWAYVPSPLLHQMGIHYYPNRWWALAVPCWLVVLVLYIYVALASYNTRYLTLPLSSCENLVDEAGQVAIIDRRTGKIVRNRAIPSSKETDNDQGKVRGSGFRSDSLSAYQFGAAEEVDWKSFWNAGTDAVLDIPIGGVCEVLYGGLGDDAEM
jgi:phosphatidylinositol glycan class P protein